MFSVFIVKETAILYYLCGICYYCQSCECPYLPTVKEHTHTHTPLVTCLSICIKVRPHIIIRLKNVGDGGFFWCFVQLTVSDDWIRMDFLHELAKIPQRYNILQ